MTYGALCHGLPCLLLGVYLWGHFPTHVFAATQASLSLPTARHSFSSGFCCFFSLWLKRSPTENSYSSLKYLLNDREWKLGQLWPLASQHSFSIAYDLSNASDSSFTSWNMLMCFCPQTLSLCTPQLFLWLEMFSSHKQQKSQQWLKQIEIYFSHLNMCWIMNVCWHWFSSSGYKGCGKAGLMVVLALASVVTR